MDAVSFECLTRKLAQSQTLYNLQFMLQELLGSSLAVFYRGQERVEELYPNAEPSALPTFCRVLRESPEGKRSCMTCRELLSFAACYHGTMDYTCHGGVLIVASHAINLENFSEFIIVTTYAFAGGDQKTSWKKIRTHTRNLPVDMRRLQTAHSALPTLSGKKLNLAKSIVNVAAAAVRDLISEISLKQELEDTKDPSSELEREIQKGLHLTQDLSLQKPGQRSGTALVRLVQGMVSRNPGLRFNVANIARAARISPNYFSTVFKEYAGQGFAEFLTDKRIDFARELLKNLRLNISEVAEKAGFHDPAYFTRRFKHRTGMTPTEWRGALCARTPDDSTEKKQRQTGKTLR